MTNQNNAAPAATTNPLSDEYVNAVIKQHGYQSPEAVTARLYQWIGLHGGENGVTLLIYEAHKALSQLRAPVADDTDELSLEAQEHGHRRYEQGFAAGWDQCAASARVAGEAVYTLRVKGVIQTWTPTAAAFSIPDGEHQLFLSPAAPQASEPGHGTEHAAHGLGDVVLPRLPPITHEWAALISDSMAKALENWARAYTRTAILADRQRQAMIPASRESGNSHTDGGAVYE